MRTEPIEVNSANHVGGVETINQRPATCVEDGFTGTTYCKGCGGLLSTGRTIPKTNAHSWTEGAVVTEATCTEQGVREFTCTVCRAVKTEPISPTGHKTEILKGRAKTCTEPGLTEGEKCAVCGKILKAQEKIEAPGHIWSEGVVTKPAKCDEQGEMQYTCEVCGAVQTKSLSPTGHSFRHKTDAATCTEDGAEYDICAQCGVKTNEKPIPAVGHTAANAEGKCERCGILLEDPGAHTEPNPGPDEPGPDPIDPDPIDPTPAALRGDANLDGKVLANDARLVLRASAKLETLEGQAFVNCDLNGDGKLLAGEARKILRYSAKLESAL